MHGDNLLDEAAARHMADQAELSEHKAVLAKVVQCGDAVIGLIDHLIDMQAIDWPDDEEEKMFSWLRSYRPTLTRAAKLLEKNDVPSL